MPSRASEACPPVSRVHCSAPERPSTRTREPLPAHSVHHGRAVVAAQALQVPIVVRAHADGAVRLDHDRHPAVLAPLARRGENLVGISQEWAHENHIGRNSRF